jgi:hypothetical protein
MALEYLVKHLLYNQAIAQADALDEEDQTVAEELALFAENCGSDLERSTVSNADPATSDHVTALVSDSVRRLVDELLRERGLRRG